MNRAQQANIRAFRQLDARIAQSEADAEAAKWEQARLAFEAIESGMTQAAYGQAVGKDRTFIGRLCKVWKKWGSTVSALTVDVAFTDAYRMVETATDDVGASLARRRGEPATPAIAAERMAEQMLDDPKVAKEAIRQVMARSSPTRRAVESVVQTSRHERKAAEKAKKQDLADRSALPFSAFLAQMGIKLDEFAFELQGGRPDLQDLVDRGYNLDSLCRSVEHLISEAEVWVKIIHPELNHIPDNIIDIG
jgi:hypothetical protein